MRTLCRGNTRSGFRLVRLAGHVVAGTLVALAASAGNVRSDAGAMAAAGNEAAPIIMTRAELTRALDQIVAHAGAGRTVRWELAREHPFEMGTGTRYRLTAPDALIGGRNWFELEAARPGGGTYLLPVDLAWEDSVWVATRPLPAGYVLGERDVARTLRWHAHAASALATGDVVGLRVRKAVSSGEILLGDGLTRPPDVARGAWVRLVFRAPGLIVTTRAKALDEGWAGGEIRVQPIDSRHVCQALVRSAEELEVIAP
jgi:flagella basal body P-ring formation protein FlgA